MSRWPDGRKRSLRSVGGRPIPVFLSTLLQSKVREEMGMPAATEGYADAKAAQAIATSEANFEKAINRHIRWTIALVISTMGFGVSMAALLLAD